MLNNENFRKGVLMDALPSDIIDVVSANKTSLGNNPSIPDIFDVPFLLKITEQGFEAAKNKLKEIGEINDVEETELGPALSKLILKCKELEKPHRNELEKCCINYVIEEKSFIKRVVVYYNNGQKVILHPEEPKALVEKLKKINRY